MPSLCCCYILSLNVFAGKYRLVAILNLLMGLIFSSNIVEITTQVKNNFVFNIRTSLISFENAKCLSERTPGHKSILCLFAMQMSYKNHSDSI